ncbi:MAG: trypsin-like peptidase domain-containing protein [Erysipelotrichaceae bacterium]|nr:trypsin-like peptidase domain-containing protein [Erysipelotrichaceae bacterium]
MNEQIYDEFQSEKSVSENEVQARQSETLAKPILQRTKRKKSLRAGAIAAIIALCIISGGIGGGLALMLSKNGQKAVVPDTVIITNGTSTVEVVNVSVETGTILSVPEIAAKVTPAIVCIDVNITSVDHFGRTSESAGSGSGILISEDGYILTNNHVVEGASAITVTLATGKEYTAVLIGADSQTDLAVLKIDDTNLPYAILGDSDSLQTGDLAVAIGNPLGELANTVTTGIISATDREITIDDETMNLLQTDAAINPGNSGGALCNQYGEVIGVVNAKTSASGIEGLGFAIPINDVKAVIGDLIENGYVSDRASIGISVQEVTEQTASFYHSEAGVYVTAVIEGGAADLAGVKSGDLIVSLDGQAVDSVAVLKAIKENHSPNDKLELVVKRDGKTLTLEITLQEEK